MGRRHLFPPASIGQPNVHENRQWCTKDRTDEHPETHGRMGTLLDKDAQEKTRDRGRHSEQVEASDAAQKESSHPTMTVYRVRVEEGIPATPGTATSPGSAPSRRGWCP